MKKHFYSILRTISSIYGHYNLQNSETTESGVDNVVNTLPENLGSVRGCDGIFKRLVQREYTSEKIPSKHQLNEFSLGRSMVEMLGVLAIIGVLSVGAISGYSKAMMKYKLNKHAEQINTVINAISRNVHSFDDIKTEANSTRAITKYFTKMGEIPKEMLTSYEDYLSDIFKTEIYIAINTTENSSNKQMAMFFMLDRLKTKSIENLEICKNIVLTAKENSDSIQYISVVGDYSNPDSYAYYAIWGDNYCATSTTCFKNITLDDIYTMCTKLIGKQKTHLVIVWKI